MPPPVKVIHPRLPHSRGVGESVTAHRGRSRRACAGSCAGGRRLPASPCRARRHRLRRFRPTSRACSALIHTHKPIAIRVRALQASLRRGKASSLFRREPVVAISIHLRKEAASRRAVLAANGREQGHQTDAEDGVRIETRRVRSGGVFIGRGNADAPGGLVTVARRSQRRGAKKVQRRGRLMAGVGASFHLALDIRQGHEQAAVVAHQETCNLKALPMIKPPWSVQTQRLRYTHASSFESRVSAPCVSRNHKETGRRLKFRSLMPARMAVLS